MSFIEDWDTRTAKYDQEGDLIGLWEGITA